MIEGVDTFKYIISVNKVVMVKTRMTYRNHWLNCGFPCIWAITAAPELAVKSADIPNPWIETTLRDPMREHMEMYTSIY